MADRDDGPARRRQVGDDLVDPRDAARVLARSSARRGRRPASPSRGSRPGRAASAASSRGRTGSCRRPCPGPSRRAPASTATSRSGARAARGCAARMRPRCGPCPRRSGDPDPGRRARRSPRDGRRGVRAASAPSIEDPALGRSEQAIEVADERRLARSVLADDRDPLAGADRDVDPVERPRSAGVDVDEAGRLDDRAGRAAGGRAHPRQLRQDAGRRPPDRAPRAASARVSRARAGGSTPSAAQAGVVEDLGRRSVEDDPAAVDRDDPAAQARRAGPSCARRSGATVPRLGEGSERLADEPRAGRIELGGRLVEDDVARAASRAATRSPTSCAWPPESRCGSRIDERLQLQASRSPRGSARPSRATGKSEVHRTDRDLLEDRGRDPRPLGVRVLEADHDALGELVRRQARRRRRRRASASLQAAPDRGRRKTRRDQAQRRLARLVRSDEPDDLAVVEAAGRSRGGPPWRSRRSGRSRP